MTIDTGTAQQKRRVTTDSAAMSLIKRYALLVVSVVIIWPTYMVVSVAGANLSATRILVPLGIAGTVWAALADGQVYAAVRRILRKFWWIFATYFALFLWKLLCDVTGLNAAHSLPLTIIEMAGIMGVMLAISVPMVSDSLRQKATLFVAGFALLAISLGVFEALTRFNIGGVLVKFSSTSSRELQVGLSSSLIRDGAYRAKSIFVHPIVYSQFLGAMAPVIIHAFFFGMKKRRYVLFAAVAAILALAVVTMSARSGLIVFLVASAAYALMLLVPVNRLTLSGLLIGIGAILGGAIVVKVGADVLQPIISGRTAEEASSSAARDSMISRSLQAIEASPWSGYGHGHAALYGGLTGRDGVVTLDNYYLTVLLDAGWIGLALTMLLLAQVLLCVGSALTKAENLAQRSLVGAYGAMAVASVTGLYVVSNWDSLMYVFMAAAVGIGFATDPPAERRRIYKRPPAAAPSGRSRVVQAPADAAPDATS